MPRTTQAQTTNEALAFVAGVEKDDTFIHPRVRHSFVCFFQASYLVAAQVLFQTLI